MEENENPIEENMMVERGEMGSSIGGMAGGMAG